MYIEKRWLVPAALSLLLLGSLLAVALVVPGSGRPGVEGAPRFLPAAASAQEPEEVFDITTTKSDGTQITTRGFGDIGLQFQGVDINAPITVVHVSSEGNNNASNINTGDHDRITSDQDDLQSNRSDGDPAG